MSYSIKPRSEWTSAPEGFSHPLTAANVKGAVIHYPGDGNVTRKGTSETFSESLFRAYRNYHVNGRGWSDIGYNFGVDHAGRIWSLAGKKKAAHCASAKNPYANYYYVGILLLVGNDEAPTDEMISAVNWLLKQINSWYGITEVLPHKGVYGASTACPGNKVTALITSGVIGLSGAVSSGSSSSSSSTTTTTKKNTRAARTYKAGEVKAIQTVLKSMGYYSGALDDSYDDLTYEAVYNYQSSQLYGSLAKDGDWGPATQAHYEWVKTLQTVLNKWESEYEDLVVDGDYRTYTHRRVLEVQQRNKGGVYRIKRNNKWVYGAVDGIPGEITCAMLGIPVHP